MSSGLRALSLLDFQHPGAAVALASCADECGYRRMWLGEHHSSWQCGNPLLLGSLLAGVTQRLRLGSGGVSLTYANPYRVAEDARLIEFMMRGRFDLGITRGLVNASGIEEVLLDGRTPSEDSYYQRLALVHGLVTGRLPEDHPLAGAPPYLEGAPPVWVLGLSPRSAAFAGRAGTGFCVSLHHATSRVHASHAIAAYRRHFRPSPEFTEPEVIVVTRCIAAPTEAEARRLVALAEPAPPSACPAIVGATEDCVEQLCDLADTLGAQEVMLLDFLLRDQSARIEMYRGLAHAARLEARPAHVS